MDKIVSREHAESYVRNLLAEYVNDFDVDAVVDHFWDPGTQWQRLQEASTDEFWGVVRANANDTE